MRLSITAVTTALVLAGLSSAIPVTKQNTPPDLVARYEDPDVRKMGLGELYSRSFDDEPGLYSRIYVPPVSGGVAEMPSGSSGSSGNTRPLILAPKPTSGGKPNGSTRSRLSAVDLYARGHNQSKRRRKGEGPNDKLAGPHAPIRELVDADKEADLDVVILRFPPGEAPPPLAVWYPNLRPMRGEKATFNQGGQGGQGGSGQSGRSRRAFDDWQYVL
ncbi:hypothetical protein AX17_007141 [Amanita inopinata Kibby_2008]|nr:hypothetical protein AX17_007141 [Amanita inopinata Kibby_2008]